MRYIYVIGEDKPEAEKSYYKIGFTLDIGKRLSRIQNGYPKKLKVFLILVQEQELFYGQQWKTQTLVR